MYSFYMRQKIIRIGLVPLKEKKMQTKYKILSIVFLFFFVKGFLQSEEKTIYFLTDPITALEDWRPIGEYEPMEIVDDPESKGIKWVQINDTKDDANTSFRKSVSILNVKKVRLDFIAKVSDNSKEQAALIVFYDSKKRVLNGHDEKNWIRSKNSIQINDFSEKNYVLEATVPEGAVRCEVYLTSFYPTLSKGWYRDIRIIIEE